MPGNPLDRLPGIIARTVGRILFYDAVLSLPGDGGGTSYEPVAGPPAEHPCRALVTEFSNYSRANGLVAREDRKVLIAADTLRGAQPRQGATITLEGDSYLLVSDGGSAPAVRRDPSTSVWTCRGRR